MAAVAELLNSAGPFAGWVSFALVVLSLLWSYSTDRLVSSGRHDEQADHFRQQLELQQRHYEEQIGDLQQAVEAHHADKVYWRDHALELMAVASKAAGP